MKIKKYQFKKIYIEFLRIIAIWLLIFNHTGDRGFLLYSYNNTYIKVIYLFLSISCKVAVPIFFMITGALLLNKKESFKDIMIKRVLKYIIILFVISFFIIYIIAIYIT